MEAYAGLQFVGIDLHRRRTVIVRTTEAGEVLEAVRIVNDVQRLASVMARAGQCPEVVLEATYGGTGLWTRCRPVVPTCTWPTRWGSRPLSTAGSRTTFEMPRIWRTCCGWAAYPRHGSRRRPPGSCVSWSGTEPSWWGCVRTAKPRCMLCWPNAGSRC